jgi:hypothetical protein
MQVLDSHHGEPSCKSLRQLMQHTGPSLRHLVVQPGHTLPRLLTPPRPQLCARQRTLRLHESPRRGLHVPRIRNEPTSLVLKINRLRKGSEVLHTHVNTDSATRSLPWSRILPHLHDRLAENGRVPAVSGPGDGHRLDNSPTPVNSTRQLAARPVQPDLADRREP